MIQTVSNQSIINERYAVYFVPDSEYKLSRFLKAWLGMAPKKEVNAFLQSKGVTPKFLLKCVEAPRRYGLHATIMAPFELVSGVGEAELRNRLQQVAGEFEAFEANLEMAERDSTLVLRNQDSTKMLLNIHHRVITSFDDLRAPLSDFDFSRRSHLVTCANQKSKLKQWGYPNVLEFFQFHITLTSDLLPKELNQVRDVLEELVGSELRKPISINNLCLCHQKTREDHFDCLARFSFREPTE